MTRYYPEAGIFEFDQGFSSLIGENQTFTIYEANEDVIGVGCDSHHVVAYGHTTTVDPISSVAIVDEFRDARGVKAGDVVMIRKAGR